MPSTSAECWDLGARDFAASMPSPLGEARVAGPTRLPVRPLEFDGSRIARAVLRLSGWRVACEGLPARQGVVIVYPHTSNWDFVWAMLAKCALGVPVTFWGKATLFRVPLMGRWLRWLGGIPVVRDAPNGVVGQMAQRLREARERDEFMWLGLSPEGTRRLTAGWRSGFHQVALQADVPVMLAYLDYARREVGLDSAWRLSGDARADLACFAQRLQGRTGRRPAQAAPVRLL
ncbi:MAG TPA: 1-acyl-sn-glycerol-3-phosphate acyltransferase [Burkholderiaceae bacterium]